jgi:DNA replicative helicase MCM subunit Mcm2 (Cdc46/Mcm family)
MLKRSNGRIQRRRSNGRFRRTTMKDFGLHVFVCQDCRSMNPVELDELGKPTKPEACHNCGSERLE